MRFALIGYPLGHSMSKTIHETVFAWHGLDATYAFEPMAVLDERAMERLKAKYDGWNVTIPHKQKIIPYLDGLDDSAIRYGAVNTVLNRNGQLIGYNTDAWGFVYGLRRQGLSLADKRILLLGAGGAAGVAAGVAAKDAGEVHILSRTQSRARALANRWPEHVRAVERPEGPYDGIINTTPAGMWPRTHDCAVIDELIAGAGFVYDCIYNPVVTPLVLKARAAGKVGFSGVDMLIGQAIRAQQIWLGGTTDRVDELRAQLLTSLKRDFPLPTVLIGFMGCGKSTVGKILAEKLGCASVDLDAQIETQGMPIPDIFRLYGEEEFRRRECETLAEALRSGGVIAAGGGLVTWEESRRLLRENACRVIYLDTPFEEAYARIRGTDRPKIRHADAEQVRALYEARIPLYQAAADATVTSGATPEDTAARIADMLRD